MSVVAKIKATDTTNATATLASDPDLQFPMAPGESWYVDATAEVVLDSSGSWKFEFAAPAGATSALFVQFISTNPFSGLKAVNTSTSLTLGAAGEHIVMFVRGTITNGSTSGAFAIQGAQFGGGSISVLTGSGLVAFH